MYHRDLKHLRGDQKEFMSKFWDTIFMQFEMLLLSFYLLMADAFSGSTKIFQPYKQNTP